MSKHEEALKRCELDFEDRIENGNILMTGRMDIEILQETLKEYKTLKEKATPKRVIVDTSDFVKYGPNDYVCPNCNSIIGDDWAFDDCEEWSNCAFCGQALKWSE